MTKPKRRRPAPRRLPKASTLADGPDDREQYDNLGCALIGMFRDQVLAAQSMRPTFGRREATAVVRTLWGIE